MTTVPFDRLRHMIRVPVTVGGDPYLFLVDTGIGVTVVSPAVAARADVRHTGETFTGRRMSGQEIRSPLVGLPEVRFGAYAVAGHPACVADLGVERGGGLGRRRGAAGGFR
jgi:predicted aspartyl protease